MDPGPISDYWIDDAGVGSDGELRCALESFCDIPPTNGYSILDCSKFRIPNHPPTPPGTRGCWYEFCNRVGFQERYGDGCSVDLSSSRKRCDFSDLFFFFNFWSMTTGALWYMKFREIYFQFIFNVVLFLKLFCNVKLDCYFLIQLIVFY